MWKEIKKILSSNNLNNTDVANASNNYFVKVATDIQSSIRFNKKNISITSRPYTQNHSL